MNKKKADVILPSSEDSNNRSRNLKAEYKIPVKVIKNDADLAADSSSQSEYLRKISSANTTTISSGDRTPIKEQSIKENISEETESNMATKSTKSKSRSRNFAKRASQKILRTPSSEARI